MNPGWKQFLTWLLPCLAVLLALEIALRPNTGERNVQAFTEMVYSKAYESLSRDPELPNGQTQQPIVEGVVVRGRMPFRYGTGPDEAARAGRELVDPFQSEPAVLARGAQLFTRFCFPCHAGDGSGQGPVVLRGMLPPPSLQGARAVQMQDGEMFHILTLGQGNMPSYASQIAAEDRWKVIRHVRALQEGPR